jgi:hypothetical protein
MDIYKCPKTIYMNSLINAKTMIPMMFSKPAQNLAKTCNLIHRLLFKFFQGLTIHAAKIE